MESISSELCSETITRDQARELYLYSELADLAALANKLRNQINTPGVVTFLIDRNINYTNVCNSNCSFCGFYRPNSAHHESYVLSREQLAEKINQALDLGATRILLQGGHNDNLPYDYYLELIEWIHTNFAIEINSFSPSEIHQMTLVSGKDHKTVLAELQARGMKGLPGGGAEILDDEIRKRVSPLKIRSGRWLEIMQSAHELGLTTTATMVFGFGENIENRLNHLFSLRELQAQSLARGLQGFNGFISWPLQHNENTSLGRSRHADNYGASAIEYLRMSALARLVLNNIHHHQASWPTLGPEIAQVALNFGCDDMGSTMMEENVVSQAGAPTNQRWCMSPDELKNYIRQAGFIPAQRDSSFQIVKKFD